MSRDKSDGNGFVAAENKWTSGRKERRQSERAVVNLDQNDRIIAALDQLIALQVEQNRLLTSLRAESR